MKILMFPVNDERNHPDYGGCDGFGPGENCSQCTGMIERIDGSVIDAFTGEVLKKSPFRHRLKRAWWVLLGVNKELIGRPF